MWIRVVEVWLVGRLLASPSFHRMVQTVHKRVRRVTHGKDPEEMGGTNIDAPPKDGKGFLDHYIEELKEQFRGGPPPQK